MATNKNEDDLTLSERLTEHVLEAFHLSLDEILVLEHAAECLDRLDAIREGIREHGEWITNRWGEPRVNPLLAEERQLKKTYRQLMQSLELPHRDLRPEYKKRTS